MLSREALPGQDQRTQSTKAAAQPGFQPHTLISCRGLVRQQKGKTSTKPTLMSIYHTTTAATHGKVNTGVYAIVSKPRCNYLLTSLKDNYGIFKPGLSFPMCDGLNDVRDQNDCTRCSRDRYTK